jgi:hypothetical protein
MSSRWVEVKMVEAKMEAEVAVKAEAEAEAMHLARWARYHLMPG